MPSLTLSPQKKLPIIPASFCKVCGNKLKGRRDKKYCNQDCKNIYHSTMRRLHRSELETDLKILFRNRTILHELLDQAGSHKKKIALDILVSIGFHSEYCTGIYINKKNKEFRYIFDYAWMPFSDREVLIMKKGGALKR